MFSLCNRPFAADILSFHSGKRAHVELMTLTMALFHCCVPVSRVSESACTDPAVTLTHLNGTQPLLMLFITLVFPDMACIRMYAVKRH